MKSDNESTLLEQGTVIQIKGSVAVVEIPVNTACGGCSHCSAGAGGQVMLARVNNRLKAKKGDQVKLERQKLNQVSFGFLLFILPLITFAGGFIVGEALFNQGIGLLFGLVGGALPFLGLRLNRKHYEMKMIEILPKKNQ